MGSFGHILTRLKSGPVRFALTINAKADSDRPGATIEKPATGHRRRTGGYKRGWRHVLH
jgi:hypothetical protein